MKNSTIKTVYLIAGIIFCLLSICCVLTNTTFTFHGNGITLSIEYYTYVLGGSLIMFFISIFMFFSASICDCEEEIFKNHLIKY